jgi:hypothetical protein
MFSGWGGRAANGDTELHLYFSGACREGGPLKHKWALCDIVPRLRADLAGGVAGCPGLSLCERKNCNNF